LLRACYRSIFNPNFAELSAAVCGHRTGQSFAFCSGAKGRKLQHSSSNRSVYGMIKIYCTGGKVFEGSIFAVDPITKAVVLSTIL
jgi:hypothetical protein